MIKASFFPPLSLLARSSLSLELEAVEGTDRWPRADLDARGHLRFPCGKVCSCRPRRSVIIHLLEVLGSSFVNDTKSVFPKRVANTRGGFVWKQH